MSLMYEHTHTWNPLVGCRHECVYCYARRVAKRQKHRCIDCYNFVPHEHPERLGKRFPKGSQVFVCSMGDIVFASVEYRKKVYEAIERQPEVTFLLQTKNPVDSFFWDTYNYDIDLPKNAIYGITLETNRKYSQGISDAPDPASRVMGISYLSYMGYKTYVTVEPIMEFDMNTMKTMIDVIKPEFVYVGYDNHKSNLPEPGVEQTLELIEELEKFTEVRKKTIR